MKNFNREDLAMVLDDHPCPCITIYMETHPVGPAGEQDAARLRDLLRDVEHRLSGHWMRAADARRSLAPARAISADPVTWNMRNRGLAVFMAADTLHVFRLPTPVEDTVTVGDRFRIRPLLPLLAQEVSYYLLALSSNHITLYAGDQDRLTEIDVAALPRSMDRWLNIDSTDRGAQVHSAARGGTAGKQAAVFHGQGGHQETRKVDRLSFLRAVDAAVVAAINGTARPLLLAGVKDVATQYRQVNSYELLLDELVTGNHDHDSPTQLHASTRLALGPYIERQAARAVAQFVRRRGTPRALEDARQVVAAATQKRVSVLFYRPQADVQGTVDEQTGEVQLLANGTADDLIDLAAHHTLRGGGHVQPMDKILPVDSPLAALLAY